MFVFCLVPVLSFAQTGDQMEILREAAKANKKLIVSTNMQLTEEEAKNFWPVYEEYQKALSELSNKTADLIKDYANHYNELSDEKAKSLVEQALALDEELLKLQRSYLPKFNEVLPVKKVARYWQIENKLLAIIDYDLARGIPLMK